MFPALVPIALFTLATQVDGPVQYKFSLTFGARITVATVDSDGNVYFGGSTTAALPSTPGAFEEKFAPCAAVLGDRTHLGHPSCNWAFAGKLAPDGSLVWLTYVGEPNGNSEVKAISIDSKRNLYLVVNYRTADGLAAAFPTTPGAFGTTPSGYYIAELNASGTALVYATYFPVTSANFSIQPDAQGNLYIGLASGNVVSLPLINPIQGTAFDGYGYLAKLNATGSALMLGTGLSAAGATTGIFHLAMDAAGALYVVGGCANPSPSKASCVPTTADAYQSETAATGTHLFAMKLKSDGTVVYSTLINAMEFANPDSVTVDSGGTLILAGSVGTDGPGQLTFPTTNGAFQPTAAKRNRQSTDSGFLTKLNATGTGLIYSTYFGGSSLDYILAVAVMPSGDLIFSGDSYSPDLPITRDAWQPCHPLPDFNYANGGDAAFVGEMSADGQTLRYATFVGPGALNPNGAPGFFVRLAGVDASGDLYMFGDDSTLPVILRYKMTPSPRGSASCVVSATHGYEVPVSSLGLIRIRGYDVSGGRTLAPTLTADGTLPQISDGLQVFIGGLSASLLEVSSDEITVIAPTQLPSIGSTSLAVTQNGLVTAEFEVALEAAAPGIITFDGSGFGSALALNEDGSVNSPDHPAVPGAVVALYLTGLGEVDPPSQFQSGTVAEFAGTLMGSTHATLYESSAQVLYSGPAPGLLTGFFQVNIRVPATGLEDWVPLGISVADQLGQSQSGNAEVGIYCELSPGIDLRSLSLRHCR